jgi:hypothetical protein
MSEEARTSQEEQSDEVPSATVPADVQPHGGQQSPDELQDGSYVDGNLDVRGDVRAGTPQSQFRTASLDDEHDTTLRTDGTGHGQPDLDGDG